ncbi:hypothetical protein D3Z46_13810 [Bacteroides sartorii]|nr:hypothetical protein [Phocaeicola sartorii]
MIYIVFIKFFLISDFFFKTFELYKRTQTNKKNFFLKLFKEYPYKKEIKIHCYRITFNPSKHIYLYSIFFQIMCLYQPMI